MFTQEPGLKQNSKIVVHIGLVIQLYICIFLGFRPCRPVKAYQRINNSEAVAIKLRAKLIKL